MAASREDISSWFGYGIRKGATHMIVVCDTYDWEDYPVYVMPKEDIRIAVDRCSSKEMSNVMEVYNLSLDKEKQMSEHRAYNL